MIYGPGIRGALGKAARRMQYFGPCRVWLKGKQMPGLAMTRSIGDMIASPVGVTAEPEIKTFPEL